jgi:hypothetical protein
MEYAGFDYIVACFGGSPFKEEVVKNELNL